MGQSAFVPAGQIHGTITTAPDTIMISFQVPPDLVLYTGFRDSSRPGAAAPKGDINAGAVRYFNFADKYGVFVSPAMGAKRAIAAYRKLEPGEIVPGGSAARSEQLVFVWKGSIVAKSGTQAYTAGEKDTIFSSGPIQLTVPNQSANPALVVHVQTPPPE